MATKLTIGTDPLNEPVSLREAKEHLRIDTNTEDIFIMGLVKAARKNIEDYTGVTFIETVYNFYLDESDIRSDVIELPQGPISSVTQIQTFGDDNVGTTFAASNYYADDKGLPGRVALISGATWPTSLRKIQSMHIQYIAGYGAESFQIPSGRRHLVKESILQTVARWYEYREEEDRLPETARRLARSIKVLRL